MSHVVRAREAGELKIIPNGDPIIFSEGRIGAIVKYPVLVDEGQGYVEKTFEKFVRSPGTRIIAVKEGKIYMQKESRMEQNGAFDWRLPGGKVVDTFEEYKQYFGKTIPEEIILSAAKKELKEEAQLEAQKVSILCKKTCGATVEWDLYYVVAEELSEVQHDYNEGEQIEEGKWFTFAEVREMCENGSIDEGRTVGVLLQFISQK